jgi:hypothetical protein
MKRSGTGERAETRQGTQVLGVGVSVKEANDARGRVASRLVWRCGVASAFPSLP